MPTTGKAIIYANKGRRPLNGFHARAPSSATTGKVSCDPVHPTVKPVEIFRLWYSQPVLPARRIDPRPLSADQAPALIAAAEMNRRAIGIEIEERYCEVAARRVERVLNHIRDLHEKGGRMKGASHTPLTRILLSMIRSTRSRPPA